MSAKQARNLELEPQDAGPAPAPSKFKRTLEEAKEASDRWLERPGFKRKLETEGTVLPPDPPRPESKPVGPPPVPANPATVPGAYSSRSDPRKQAMYEEARRAKRNGRYTSPPPVLNEPSGWGWGFLRILLAIGLLLFRIFLSRR